MSPVLEVENVTVRFGGVTAIDNASLTIQMGDLIGFIGPNGAGKTTLMRAITGIVKPQRGSIKLEGRNLSGLTVSQRIRAGLALAQQIVQPLREMSILDNVSLACGAEITRHPWRAMTSFSRRATNAKAIELLARVGIEDKADSAPDTLPLGYLKRLEFARALALAPRLLLLDEPLAGLNQSEAKSLANLILSLNKDGLTILLIEHNLHEVLRICPRIYVQERGSSLAFGQTKEVMSQPAVIEAYLGGS